MKRKYILFILIVAAVSGLSSCDYPRINDRMDGESFVRNTVPLVLGASDDFFRKIDKHISENSRDIKFTYIAMNASVPNRMNFSTTKREFLTALLATYERTLGKLAAENAKADSALNERYTLAVRIAGLFAGLEREPEKAYPNLRRFYFQLGKHDTFDPAFVDALNKELPESKKRWSALIGKLR